MCNPTPMTPALEAWNDHWHGDTDETLFCTDCGTTVLGDGPPRAVQCAACWPIMRNCTDGTVCYQCFEPGDEDSPAVTPMTLADGNPDGFTCCRCGDAFCPSKTS